MERESVKIGKTYFDTTSLVVQFGLSLSQLAKVYGVSRNMMSLIHHNKRTALMNKALIDTVFVSAKQICDESHIQTIRQECEDSFLQEKRDWLHAELNDLRFFKIATVRKIEEIESVHTFLYPQLARCKTIDTSIVPDDKTRTAFQNVINANIEKKQKLLSQSSPVELMRLQLKIDALDFQINRIENLLKEIV